MLPESGRIRVPDNVPNSLASLSSCAFRSVMNAFEISAASRRTRRLPSRARAHSDCWPRRWPRRPARGTSSSSALPTIGWRWRNGLAERRSFHREARRRGRLAAVRDATDGRGADVVMEFTGHPAAFGEGLEIVRRGGRYLIVGQLGEGSTEIKPSTIVKKNIRVIGSFSGDARSYWKALTFVSRHIDDIPFGAMISNRYRLDDVNKALARMKRMEEIKPVMNWSEYGLRMAATRKFDATNRGPLDGVRVIDLSRLVAGNMATLQLADYGADVIKIEHPQKGDDLRNWRADGVATFWKVYGRNKRSIALESAKGRGKTLPAADRKRRSAGRELRAGTLEKWGYGPDELHAV